MYGGMIEIFAKCPKCGADGVRIRKIQKWANEHNIMLAIYKTTGSGNTNNFLNYRNYLHKFNIQDKPSIMVFDSNKLERLDEWNQS